MIVRTPRKDWTVLYYLNGNNDLEPNLVSNMIEAEKVGSSDQVNIVAQLSRAPQEVVHPKKGAKKTGLDGDWSGMRRYYVSHSSSRKKITSEVLTSSESPPNYGKSESLAEFLRWGMKNYPAKHTMVVLGDHGAGFAGTGFDYLHKDVLDLGELKDALGQAPRKPDIVVMDACEMGAAEVAYQIKDQAKLLIASEEVIGLGGLPHKLMLEHLQQNPDTTPTELARNIVRISSDDTYARLDRGKDPATEQLAALRLDGMPALAQSVSQLGKTLAQSAVSAESLKSLIEDTQSFNLGSRRKPDSDYRDLRHFSQLLQSECSDPAVQKAAARVEKALGRVVLENHCSGEELADGNGLSVYLPAGPIRADKARMEPNGKSVVAHSDFAYQETDFDRATDWSGWLARKFPQGSHSKGKT